jgi:spectinomycin phosphotransferase
MDTNHPSIGDLLAREYGISPVAIKGAPRGFVAETHTVQSPDGRRFLVKLIPRSSRLAGMTRGLSVLEELHALGIDTVSHPVRARDGRLTAEIDGRILIVFDFIEGRAGTASDWQFSPSSFDYDFDQYVALLARIHQATPRIQSAIPREDFRLPWAAEFERLLERVHRERPSTTVQADLRRLVQRHRDQMTADWSVLLTLAQACRQSGRVSNPPLPSLVITHGDALGDNVIVGSDGRLYLIDWDEVMLGPPERDTWFYLNDAAPAEAFLQRYRKAFPDYHPDPVRHRFYLFRRFFEDLLGYVQHIVESPSVEYQAWNVAELEKTCFQ